MKIVSLLPKLATIAMVIVASPALRAATFQWPVANPNPMSNAYATFNAIGNNKYHTGFDLTSATGSTIVRAAAAGVARTIPIGTYANQNHNMGNVIIIDHYGGAGPFTLYAHLASISISNGQSVSAGQQIGIMGNTGTGAAPGQNIHLHFEVKHWGVLGNLDDDLGPVWGYTTTQPNLYGYINPWPYLDYSLIRLAPTVTVRSDVNQIVRTGPDPSLYTTVVATVSSGQRFTAFARNNNWYQIYLPSINGPATGWIEATSDPVTRLEVDDPVRGTIGVSVRASASSSSNLLSYVWDNQWFARSSETGSGNGCSQSWYQIYLASNAGSALGWVCGQFLDVYPSTTTCTSFSINPTGANSNASSGSQAVTITGSPSGCQGGGWSASGNGSWLTVSPTSGTGSGSTTVFWTQNTSTSSRSASATIAGNSFNVNQAGSTPPTCTSFSINPTGANPSASSGSQAVTITGSPSGCQGGNWSASGNGSWLTVSPTSGTGSGSVTVFWTQNTSTSSRSASATIAGNSFNVNQAGSTSPTCTSFSINPTGANPNASSGSQAVAITGSPSGCQGGSWSASGNGSWLTVSPTSGTGSGSVTVFWTQNTSTSSRSASATIAGNSFNVNQQAPLGVQAAVTPADFDGDGVSDWVVYRDGAWVYFGPCDHPLNVTGPALDPACSPCVATVCSFDAFCCATFWDDACVSEAGSLCQ